jgi:MFS family permease
VADGSDPTGEPVPSPGETDADDGSSADVTKALADRRPVSALLTAEGISQVGNMMTIVAGPWFVLQTTGSAAKTGLVGAALALGLLVPIIGGPFVDRLGFRRGSILADLVSASTVASIPALHLAGLLEYWHIVVLVFILTSVNSQGDTARLALLPALARLARMPSERVNARDRAIARLGSVLGPFLAGISIAWIGAANVLFVDAGTFTISAVLVATFVPRAVDSRERRPADRGERRYMSELADGLRFVRSKTFLLSMMLVATVGNFFDQPLLTVIAPVYAKEIYGSPASFGALVGSFGAGAFAGSLLFGAVGRRWPRRRIFLTSYVVGASLIYGTLALSPPLAVAIVAAVAAGLAFGPVNPIFATVTQENTPPHLLGRVFGVLTTIAQAAIPLGAVVAGFVVQRAGLIPTIVGMGSVYVLVTIGMFFNPRLQAMDVRRDGTGEPIDVQAADVETVASRTADIHR